MSDYVGVCRCELCVDYFDRASRATGTSLARVSLGLVPRMSDSCCWYDAIVFESVMPLDLQASCSAFRYCISEYVAPRSTICVRIS